MKRVMMALAMASATALWGCGGSSAGSSGSSGSSGSTATTGHGASTTISSSGSSGTSSTSSTGSTGTTGSGSTGTSSSGSSGTTSFTVAVHDPFPQVPNNNNGPTLHHLQLITITFPSYTYQTNVEAFGDWIVGSDWLTTVGADYDVHDGTQVAKVHLTDAAPATVTDDQIQQYLTSKIADGTLPAPGSTLSGSTTTLDEPLYAIFYPATTTISLQGATSCQEFGGYHSFFTYTPSAGSSVNVSYAVLPTCSGQGGTSSLDYLTVAASHEYIEAATDPYPDTGFRSTTGSYAIEDYSSPWAFIPGEVGDLCVNEEYTDTASGYRVQRIWSNSAAASQPGTDPCVPANPDAPFFNVSTNPGDTQALAAGATATYTVTAWSTAPIGTGKWYVGVMPYQSTFNPSFTLTTKDGQTITDADQWGTVTMGNGDTATLTVTIPAGTTSSSCQGGYCAASMVLYSSTGQGYTYNMWPVAVVEQ